MLIRISTASIAFSRDAVGSLMRKSNLIKFSAAPSIFGVMKEHMKEMCHERAHERDAVRADSRFF